MYKIYDDIVEKNDLKEICSQLTGNRFSWFLSTAVKGEVISPNFDDYNPSKYNIDQYAMFHLLVDNGSANSTYSEVAVKLINAMCAQVGVTHTGIIRAQFNLVFQHPKSNLPSCPHIDNKIVPHGVMLLYLNDSDGDTYLYKDNSRDVQERIEPKAGRLVVFDGTQVHSAGTPVKSKVRLVMNVNLREMKWIDNEKHESNET